MEKSKVSLRDVIWRLYPGKHFVDHTEFDDDLFAQGFIGVGWPATGDLTSIGCNLHAFYDRVASTHAQYVDAFTSDRHGWYGRAASILRRFVCEAHPGD